MGSKDRCTWTGIRAPGPLRRVATDRDLKIGSPGSRKRVAEDRREDSRIHGGRVRAGTHVGRDRSLAGWPLLPVGGTLGFTSNAAWGRGPSSHRVSAAISPDRRLRIRSRDDAHKRFSVPMGAGSSSAAY